MSSLPLPRVDDKLKAALARLRNSADFNLLMKYNEARLAHIHERLVSTSPEALGQLQGRALEIGEFFSNLKPKD